MRSVERNGWKDCVNCILDKLLSISMFEKWMDPSSMKFFSFFKSINSCRFRYFFLFLFRGNDRSIFVVRFLAPNLGEKKLHRVKWICIKFHESWNPVIVRMSMNCKFIQWIRLPRRQPTQTKHYFNNFSYLSREISDSWGLSWYGIFRRLIILSCSIQFRFTVVQNFKFITLVRYLGTSLLFFFLFKVQRSPRQISFDVKDVPRWSFIQKFITRRDFTQTNFIRYLLLFYLHNSS